MKKATRRPENAFARRGGHDRVAGIDEAGRGPLAGPVVAAAVVLPARWGHPLVRDSKKLTARQREEAYSAICGAAGLSWSVAIVDRDEIDRLNILQATHLGMRRAFEGLGPRADAALIDGLPLPEFPAPHEGLVKGDSQSVSIAAASILAKVTRDRIMVAAAEDFPEYGFERHKGYPTPEHLKALNIHGPTPLHRLSFAPVAQCTFPFVHEDEHGQ